MEDGVSVSGPAVTQPPRSQGQSGFDSLLGVSAAVWFWANDFPLLGLLGWSPILHPKLGHHQAATQAQPGCRQQAKSAAENHRLSPKDLLPLAPWQCLGGPESFGCVFKAGVSPTGARKRDRCCGRL